MLSAYARASKGKKDNKEVIKYEMDLACNIIQVLKQIYSRSYKVGEYRKFQIYEPKKRIIRCLSFEDRIVHTWYVEYFLKPYFIPRFIYDSYACIENKGTHKGVKRLKYFMNYMRNKYNNYYVIKFDIKHFLKV